MNIYNYNFAHTNHGVDMPLFIDNIKNIMNVVINIYDYPKKIKLQINYNFP